MQHINITGNFIEIMIDSFKLVTCLVGVFRELELLGIQQTGHKCKINTGMHHVRKLEPQTDVIDGTL